MPADRRAALRQAVVEAGLQPEWGTLPLGALARGFISSEVGGPDALPASIIMLQGPPDLHKAWRPPSHPALPTPILALYLLGTTDLGASRAERMF